MGRKRHTPEQIITALREAEVGLARGKSVKLMSRELGITEQTYYRWRREYGGMKVSQARRLKELERENGAPEASSGGLDTGQADPGGSGQGKLLSPERRRRCVVRVRQQLGRRRGERAGCSGSHARPSAGRGKWRVTRWRSEVISCDRCMSEGWVPPAGAGPHPPAGRHALTGSLDTRGWCLYDKAADDPRAHAHDGEENPLFGEPLRLLRATARRTVTRACGGAGVDGSRRVGAVRP